MPKAKQFSSDRIPTLEELQKLVEYYDRRIKAVVFTMCSSGIRIGAWEYLKWKHIIPLKDPETGEVQAAKIIIYAGEPEEHFSFVTREAYDELVKYMEYRQSYGEKITGESWLIRNYFKTADVKRKSPRGGNFGKTTNPKRIDQKSLNRLIIRAWQEQGIRETLEPGERRHQFKSAHSMRKYFKTRAEQVMNRLNVEYLLGHSIGLNSNYYRPTEQELLTDYLKAVPSLTINDQGVATLKKQLEEKDKNKEQEIEKMREQMNVMQQQITQMSRMFTLSSGNLQGVKNQETGNLEIHHFNEKTGSMESLTEKEGAKHGLKDGVIWKLEPGDNIATALVEVEENEEKGQQRQKEKKKQEQR